MKYAIIVICLLLTSLVLTIFYFRKISQKNSIVLPNTTPTYTIESEDNPNPAFEVELIDYKKAQLNINKSSLGQTIYFKKTKSKRISVYTTNKIYIGQIAIKDYKNFDLIYKHPNYFEGTISSLKKENLATKKVIIEVQAKVEYSKLIYLLNKQYYNTLITLAALFIKDEIIETNYGPSTIIDIYEDHLLVDVPSLGNREIYDIDTILKPKE